MLNDCAKIRLYRDIVVIWAILGGIVGQKNAAILALLLSDGRFRYYLASLCATLLAFAQKRQGLVQMLDKTLPLSTKKQLSYGLIASFCSKRSCSISLRAILGFSVGYLPDKQAIQVGKALNICCKSSRV